MPFWRVRQSFPEEYATFSELLCDPSLYPDEVDGGEAEPPRPSDFGAEVVIEISFLASPLSVKRAFKAVVGDAHAGDDHFAALYAGAQVSAVLRLSKVLDAVYRSPPAVRTIWAMILVVPSVRWRFAKVAISYDFESYGMTKRM